MRILLANPRGFCAGVDRAVDMVNLALQIHGAPVYVRHEIVHNRYVVDDLRGRGAIFVKDTDDIPAGSIAIFSAHGVARSVHQAAQARDLQLFDATCPLVAKVHVEVRKLAQAGYDCVLIGHSGHPEVEGTMGQYDRSHGGNIHLIETSSDIAALEVRDPDKVGFVTQTTLSVDDTRALIQELLQRYPKAQAPKKEDICYATQNRQDAVRALAAEVQLLLVVGSRNSSNSNRLRELAERCGCRSYLIDRAADIDPEWLVNVSAVGITAGASAPELIVQQVVQAIQQQVGGEVEEFDGVRETVSFPIPRELRLQAV